MYTPPESVFESQAALIAEAHECLSRIPGLYQAIGKLQDRSRRMKNGSPRWTETDAHINRFQNEAGERSSFVRAVLNGHLVAHPKK